jgi:myo-inositol-1(or 4)-monophosphatase
MSVATPQDLLECALAAARAAGRHALDHWSRRGEVLQTFAHDVKLALDLECQQIAERTIRSRFPTHAILGEESGPAAAGAAPAAAAVEWVIDPIDGTVNFSHGLPLWCCAVAARRGAETLAGAVYAPALEECFSARQGASAECNGKPIRVSTVRRLTEAVVMTGLDKSLDPHLPPFEIFRTISAAVQKARILGTAALDMCRVAIGQADGYFETGIYTWDVTAAALIVRQAGGQAEIMEQLDGHRLRFIATNGLIHAELKALIAGAVARGRA